MHAPPQWHEDRNVGMDAANKSGSEAGSDHGLWKGRVLKRVDVFELRFAQIQCDRLPPLNSLPLAAGRNSRPQPRTILPDRRSLDGIQLYPDQPISDVPAALPPSLFGWLAGERHPGGDAVRTRI